MEKFAIVMDTASNIDIELAEKYGITLIPYQVQLDDQHYRDQIDISSREFYQLIGQHDTVLSGIPSPKTVDSTIRELVDKGYKQILILTGSIRLTGMYNLCQVICADFIDEGIQIEVIDSGQIGIVIGLMGIYASLLREKDIPFVDVVNRLRANIDDSGRVYLLTRTLEYVIKGGRLGKMKGAIGTLLNIQPTLTVEDGQLSVASKARGANKSRLALIQACREQLDTSRPYFFGAFAADNDSELNLLLKDMSDIVDKAELVITRELTTVLGVHGGPKCLGVGFFYVDDLNRLYTF